MKGKHYHDATPHSPLPWYYRHIAGQHRIEDADGNFVMAGATEDDARFVVRATDQFQDDPRFAFKRLLERIEAAHPSGSEQDRESYTDTQDRKSYTATR